MRRVLFWGGLAISTATPVAVCSAAIVYSWHPGWSVNAGMLCMLVAAFGGWVSSLADRYSPSHGREGAE